MKRRTLLAAAVCVPVCAAAQTPPALSAQDRTDIGRAEASLNAIRSLKGRFQQLAPNGAVSDGTVWLERPGRMRFQYDPPSPFLLVAGHDLLVFHDASLEQTSNIPLGRTPLGLLLQNNLKLSGDVTVSGVQRYPGQIQITLYRTATPGDGTLTLIFAEPQMTLVSWAVVDAQRQLTRIRLADVVYGGTFDQSLFTFIDPKFFGNNVR